MWAKNCLRAETQVQIPPCITFLKTGCRLLEHSGNTSSRHISKGLLMCIHQLQAKRCTLCHQCTLSKVQLATQQHGHTYVLSHSHSTSQEILYGTQNPCTVFTKAFHLTLYHSLLKTAHTCPPDVLMSHYHTALSPINELGF